MSTFNHLRPINSFEEAVFCHRSHLVVTLSPKRIEFDFLFRQPQGRRFQVQNQLSAIVLPIILYTTSYDDIDRGNIPAQVYSRHWWRRIHRFSCRNQISKTVPRLQGNVHTCIPLCLYPYLFLAAPSTFSPKSETFSDMSQFHDSIINPLYYRLSSLTSSIIALP
jgi:hypothetical protein